MSASVRSGLLQQYRPIADVRGYAHPAQMKMTEALADTLAMVAQAAAVASDPWWIVGSAAVALHGGDVHHVKDVDLMMSAGDADTFLKRVGGKLRKPDTNDRFRSLVFGDWTEPPIPVEIFGGFSVAAGGLWREVSLVSRKAFTVAGNHLFVPSAEELVRLLESFGRSKDLARARSLRG